MKVKAALLISLILVSFFTTYSSAQVPIPNANPQITVDCERYDNREYISYSIGSGWVKCSITNDESKNLKIKFSWTGIFEIRASAFSDNGDWDIENGDEIQIRSEDQIRAWLFVSVGKIEPTEDDFKLEIVVTESEEFNGWQECDDCEPHEFETTYKIVPWAEFTDVQLLQSNVPGLSAGLTKNDSSEDIALECSEDILTENSISVEFSTDASAAGRNNMHIELELIIHLYQMDEYGVPRDGDRKEITISAPVNFEQPTVITTSANLDGSENRTGNDWRVSIWIGSKVYLDNYQNMPQNSVISDESLWYSWCELNNSVLDPDFIEPNGGTGGEKSGGDEKIPSINALFSLSAILMAALTRNHRRDD